MTAAQGGVGLLGGAVLTLGCVPLLARGPAAVRAAFAQAVLLAVALAGRALAEGAWGGLAGAAALLAAGVGVLRLRSVAGIGEAGGARGGEGLAGGWGALAGGLALVVLGAAAGRQAALLQGAALRDTLGLALPAVLLGLLAASLRRDAAVRGAGAVAALHGVALAGLGLPAAGAAGLGAGPIAVAVAALTGLLATALAARPASADGAAEGSLDDGIGHRA